MLAEPGATEEPGVIQFSPAVALHPLEDFGTCYILFAASFTFSHIPEERPFPLSHSTAAFFSATVNKPLSFPFCPLLALLLQL